MIRAIAAVAPARIVLSLTRRLWIMGRIGIVFEHLRDDGTSDQRL